MIVQARKGQVVYGQPIGVLLMETQVPFIPGDVGNAYSYKFPVRFEVVSGLTTHKVLGRDDNSIGPLVDAAKALQQAGVRAITGDCGFMAYYQRHVMSQVKIPVFLSSLMQLSFCDLILPPGQKIGVITADSSLLDTALLDAVGVKVSLDRIVVRGMEDSPHFVSTFLEEKGILDVGEVEREVVSVAKKLLSEEADVGVVLLECSDLPPYAQKVQQSIDRPVFDYVTMINYVHAAIVKSPFRGWM